MNIAILTMPFGSFDPDAGTVRVGGIDWPCSAPLDVYDPDNSGAFASDHVTVRVDNASGFPHDPDVVRCIYLEV